MLFLKRNTSPRMPSSRSRCSALCTRPLEDALPRLVVHDEVVDRVALGRRVLGVAADVEVEAGAVLEEDVARPAPRHDPAEQVARDLVGAEPALAAQRARDAVLVLQPEDAPLHRWLECTGDGVRRVYRPPGPSGPSVVHSPSWSHDPADLGARAPSGRTCRRGPPASTRASTSSCAARSTVRTRVTVGELARVDVYVPGGPDRRRELSCCSSTRSTRPTSVLDDDRPPIRAAHPRRLVRDRRRADPVRR